MWVLGGQIYTLDSAGKVPFCENELFKVVALWHFVTAHFPKRGIFQRNPYYTKETDTNDAAI